jgi:leader peptidase (prepilin peptidase)/N-methyltransferase
MSDWLGTAIAAGFGAIVGSFLNVCIHRLPRQKSIVSPGSACPSCGRSLAWHDNIPILSYVVLRGRCRGCGSRIAVRYPVVEAVTALLFGFCWWQFGPSVLFVSRALFAAALVALFAIDLEHHLLPNVITLPGIVVGFAFSLLGPPGWLDSLLGILLGGGILFAIAELYYRARHEEGLGMGDVKMLAMIGAFLGWKLAIVTLMMASVAGSVIGLALIATRRGDMKYALPFGTFLALGAGLSATVGPDLLDWYLGLY